MTSVAFQSILRKQIRKLPKILKSVKIIQYYSRLFIRVLSALAARAGHPGVWYGPKYFVQMFGMVCISWAGRLVRPHVRLLTTARSYEEMEATLLQSPGLPFALLRLQKAFQFSRHLRERVTSGTAGNPTDIPWSLQICDFSEIKSNSSKYTLTPNPSKFMKNQFGNSDSILV